MISKDIFSYTNTSARLSLFSKHYIIIIKVMVLYVFILYNNTYYNRDNRVILQD